MIVVTGASGQLGRLVVKELVARVGPEQVVAAVRDPGKARDFEVAVRRGDYDDPESLRSAFDGAQKVLLISGMEPEHRVTQHIAAIDAAKAVGASVAYTSATHADTADVDLVRDHRATENYLIKSGVPYTILRNNWYHEMYRERIVGAAQSGVLAGASGAGRIASATRGDYAGGAAEILASDGHLGMTYELGGTTDWDLAELAQAIASVTGTAVECATISAQEYADNLAAQGIPAPLPDILADVEVKVGRGWLAAAPPTLTELLGHSTTPITDYVAQLLSPL